MVCLTIPCLFGFVIKYFHWRRNGFRAFLLPFTPLKFYVMNSLIELNELITLKISSFLDGMVATYLPRVPSLCISFPQFQYLFRNPPVPFAR